MAFSFGFYLDPALTTPVSQRLAFVQANTAPVASDKVVWFGSPDPTVSCEALSNPGTDAIVISVVDAAPGTGSPASDIKLATSAIGLESATGGGALVLPATLPGGVGNAVEIHIRVSDSTHTSGVHGDLGLSTNPLRQA